MSPHRGAAIERLAAEGDNLRAAFTWSERSTDVADAELGCRLAAALFWFWTFRSEVNEGLEWLEALLAKAPGVTLSVRAAALHAAGDLTWLAGDNALARSLLEESAAQYRLIGDVLLRQPIVEMVGRTCRASRIGARSATNTPSGNGRRTNARGAPVLFDD